VPPGDSADPRSREAERVEDERRLRQDGEAQRPPSTHPLTHPSDATTVSLVLPPGVCHILLLLAVSATSIDPARLPENTVFYILWHGAPTPAARTANSLYALWDDPEFAPARAAMFANFLNESGKSSDAKSKITREELSEYLTLLENPFSIGYVSEPAKSVASTRLIDDKHKWNGIFFIYDRTGKEALLAKAILRMRAAEKDPRTISTITIAGIPALKEEGKSGTSYWLDSGKYLISSGEPSVIEKILTRMKSGAIPATSLGSSAAFKEANSILGGGIFEYFIEGFLIEDSLEMMIGFGHDVFERLLQLLLLCFYR